MGTHNRGHDLYQNTSQDFGGKTYSKNNEIRHIYCYHSKI